MGTALLICAGLRYWPAVLLSNFAVHSAVAAWIGPARVGPLFGLFASALVIAGLSVVIAAITRVASRGESPVGSARGVTALLLGGTLALVPTVLILMRNLSAAWPAFGVNPSFDLAALLGIGVLSLLVPGYPILAWWHEEPRAASQASRFELAALVLCFSLLAAANFLGSAGWFAPVVEEPSAVASLALGSIPLFVWAALSLGPAGCSLGMLISAAFSALSPAPGIRDAFGVFSDSRSGPIHLAFVFAGVAGIYVAAISQRLRQTAAELLASRETLERTVAERTSALARVNHELASEIVRRKRAHQIAGLGHWEWRVNRGETLISEEMNAMLGLAPESRVVSNTSIVGSNVVEEAERKRVLTTMVSAVREARPFVVEIELRHPQRGRVLIENRGDPVFAADGALIGYSGTAQDVTARRELEERLRQGQKLEALGRLAGGVAHDFNNLLTPIGGYAELLAAKLDGSEQAQQAEEIQRAAERAARLVSQLLSFARGHGGSEARVDLNQTITDMLSILRVSVGSRIDLEVELARSLPRVSASQDELDQVLLNLVVNARDALPRGGRIRLSTRFEPSPDPASGAPGCVALSVEDDGVGISASAREHLFEPFFTTKRAGEGTGLGLATVYGIVREVGGQIRVDSAAGAGARFEILFPALPGEPPRTERASTPRDLRPGCERLLLVEDEVSVRGLVRRVLEQRGYSVIEAGDPESALALVRGDEGPIDLLLTDLSMPGGSGVDLARAFRELRPGVPVVVMTGNPSDDLLEALDKDGAQVLAKPFSAAGLCASVRSCLDSKRAPEAPTLRADEIARVYP